MSEFDRARERVEELKEIIEYHNHRYYVLDQPEIEDAQYDEYMRELIELESRYPELLSEDSPSQRVGVPPSSLLSRLPIGNQCLAFQCL